MTQTAAAHNCFVVKKKNMFFHHFYTHFDAFKMNDMHNRETEMFTFYCPAIAYKVRIWQDKSHGFITVGPMNNEHLALHWKDSA